MSTLIQITPASGITVGTTPVISGTDGRIFFQDGGVVQQDSALFWDNTNRVISIGNGTAPTTSTADNFQMYSNDITAGNAAPHFKTENGSVVKLYQSPISSSIKDIVENTGLSGVNEMVYAKEQVIPFGALSIDFTEPKIYGKSTVANTSNIIDDLTNAKIGVIQKIYHNSAVSPTVPAGWVLLSGVYVAAVLNIITCEFCEGTRVEYKIIQG
jgi:hypothetical protein